MSVLDNPTGSVSEGRQTSAAPGTPTALGSDACSWVVVTAETDNTGLIAVGGTTAVRATAGSQEGAILDAGKSVAIPVDNLADLYIDASVGGDGVAYLYGVSS